MDHCLAVIREDRLVGVLGIQSRDGGFLNPNLRSLIREYGIMGAIYENWGPASSSPQERS